MVQEHFSLSNKELPLFRFISFFDLYDILVNRRLRLSKLATFSDKNEGFGHILQFQDHHLFRVAHIDELRIASTHESVLENHYISCWTTQADLISMWSLYSPDCMGIQISTTVEKLFSALQGLDKKLSWTECIDKPGSRELVSWFCALEPVEYVDFFDLRDKIRTKYQEFDQHVAAAAQKKEDYFESPEGLKKDREELHKRKVIERDGLFLKDKAYIHEDEVRAVLYCGVRNDLTVEEWRKTADPMLNLFDWAKKGELQDCIYANVDAHFVESVCFDPRTPAYKRRVFENALGNVLPEVRESKAFGYVLHQDSFASDLDGYPAA